MAVGMPYIYRFITIYNSAFFFLRLCRGKNLLCVPYRHYWEPRKALWLPAEVMNKIKFMKLFIALSVGLSFLAMIVLLNWSSTFKLHRLDGSYTGKGTFKNAQQSPISISVKFSGINYLRISNEVHFVLRFLRPSSAINPLLMSLHRPFRLHHFVSYIG